MKILKDYKDDDFEHKCDHKFCFIYLFIYIYIYCDAWYIQGASLYSPQSESIIS